MGQLITMYVGRVRIDFHATRSLRRILKKTQQYVGNVLNYRVCQFGKLDIGVC